MRCLGTLVEFWGDAKNKLLGWGEKSSCGIKVLLFSYRNHEKDSLSTLFISIFFCAEIFQIYF